MNKILKKVLVIAYIIDILLIPWYMYLIVWWKKEHNRPGLAEMTDGKRLVVELIVEIIIFVVLTVIWIINGQRKDRILGDEI